MLRETLCCLGGGAHSPPVQGPGETSGTDVPARPAEEGRNFLIMVHLSHLCNFAKILPSEKAFPCATRRVPRSTS